MVTDDKLRRELLKLLATDMPGNYGNADDAIEDIMSEIESDYDLTPEQHSACCDQIEDWWSKGD